MIVLDTDHMSVLQSGKGSLFQTLGGKMDQSVDDQFATTVVSVEEHCRGWLASIRRAKRTREEIHPYDQLLNLIRFYEAWRVLRFSERAAVRFETLRSQKIRSGTQDLKIACIALENQATLLTANRQEFERVPGLPVEDWTH